MIKVDEAINREVREAKRREGKSNKRNITGNKKKKIQKQGKNTRKGITDKKSKRNGKENNKSTKSKNKKNKSKQKNKAEKKKKSRKNIAFTKETGKKKKSGKKKTSRRKSKLGKKTSNKNRSRNKMGKNNKSKQRVEKKSMKKNKKKKSGKKNKDKKRKSDKQSRKKKARRQKGRKYKSGIRASTCLNFTCIDEAVSYLKLLKDRVANFEKQDARITRQNKTGSGKSGKKGLFGPLVRRITENGGGNSSNLTCNGAINSGADQLTNLTTTLLKCEDEIKAACDPSNLPQPNMTEVTICNTAITTFKNKTGECIKKTGSEACTCWDDATIASTAATIKTCDCK